MELRTQIAALFVVAASSALAQGPTLWRFWEPPDGLAEGYTRTLSVDGKGRLWATHGTAVNEVSVNDGYEIRRVPAPGHFGRIFPGPSESWAVTVDGLFRFENGKWVRHRVALFDGILKVGDYPDLVAVSVRPRPGGPGSPGRPLWLS